VGPDVAYAVHTRTCTYLLDEQGVCRRIISPTGMVPIEVRQCINAQFVACLDLTQEGGLAGELLLGAAALFVKRDPATERLQLLRTGMIVQVETKRGEPSGVLAPVSRGGDTTPPPAGFDRPASLRELSRQVLDVSESTVTLTLPLFRPEAQEGRAMLPPARLPPPTIPEDARPTQKGTRRSRHR
jgi:hypothetical protein